MRSFPLILGVLLLGCALDHHSEDTPSDAGPILVPQRRREAGVDATSVEAREPARDQDAEAPELPLPARPDAALSASDASYGPAPDAQKVVTPELCNGRDDDADGKLDEGCVMRLVLDDTNRPTDYSDTSVRLNKGRLIWAHTNEDYIGQLWTSTLPTGSPQLLFTHKPPIRATHDGERVVYSDYDRFGFTLLDLSTGSERLIKPFDPAGTNLLEASLQGHYLAYSQDMRGSCGGCEDRAIFLHDLETGQTQVVEPDPFIQGGPRLSASFLVWWDDRYGHHTDSYGLEHRYDVMAVALPYVPGSLKRLTQAPPRSASVIDFRQGRVLIDSYGGYEAPPPQDLQTASLIDVASQTLLPVADILPIGDRPLALSATHMLVRRDPLVRCHLELVELKTRHAFELPTAGDCPDNGQLDGDYVLWTRKAGSMFDVYWMDVGDRYASP